jgi:GTP pyrophosphokinase
MVTRTVPQPGAATAEWTDADAVLGYIATGRADTDTALIRRAYDLAAAAHEGQKRASGEPYVMHTLHVAAILADLHLDAETLAAALLHDVVEDTTVTLDDVRGQFGPAIAALVDGVTRMRYIPGFETPEEGRREAAIQAESLRKMLLAMAEDVRVVLVKLADRLHNMRTLRALSPERQQRIARETLEIFAPLANRLGIWQIKWELEDLAFRYLEPARYHEIAKLLAERRADREAYVARFVERLAAELKTAGIDAEVTGRAKHIYGIWKKMQRKGKGFGQIYDVRAVRILVPEVRDCYAALGVVHTLFSPVPGEFDDYIATPKENAYRSIHTAVVGPEGKTVEVQIRTHRMHEQSELGVAAHWRYKEGRRPEEGFDRKIAWLRSLLEWKDEVAHAGEFVDRFKSEVIEERVYVFTPKGKIVDLPAGSTPLDFAYHVHTDIGHRCRGAKINGHIVPLTQVLKTGDQVEVLTVKDGGPSRDWLSPHLGYLHTSRARNKAAHYFRQQNLDASIASGREILEREFDRLGLADLKYETLAAKAGFAKVEEFLAAIGRGEVRLPAVIAQVQGLVEPVGRPAIPATRPPPVPGGAGDVTIQGVGNLLTRMARCCNPVPGDAIVGFITRGQGVTIHRRDCPNALRHHDEHGERLIEVSWRRKEGQVYPVEIEVTAIERANLLRDIMALLANEKIAVRAANTGATGDAQAARIVLSVEIADLGALSRVLALIDQIPNVTRVRRLAH